MRKDKKFDKRLSLYSDYIVTGLNLNGFINGLKSRGVTLYEVKKISDKKIKVTVNYADNEKFFAISQELCYNIKKVGEKGKLKFGLFLVKNLGILIGAIIFWAIAAFSGDFVFSIEYEGSGKVYYRVADEYFKENGVSVGVRFSSLDLNSLSDGLTAYTDKFSFAECVKYGNRLKVQLVKAKEKEEYLNSAAENLVSDVNGIITSLSVYRGTAIKSVGDRVNIGDIIVDGFAVVRDKTVKVGVVAVATVDAEYIYEYFSQNEGEEEIASILAENSVGDGEVTGTSVSVDTNGEGFLYSVKVTIRRVLYSG